MSVREHRVETAGGRALCVVEGGDPDGRAILVHHGTPGSGALDRPWLDDAAARGIRLLGYDRPGYGGSDERRGRRVADCVDDIAAILDALGVDRAASWGVSGGGPHALACAALLPERIVAVATLASVGPFGVEGLEWLAGMGEGNVVEFARADGDPAAFEAYLRDEAAGVLAATPETLADELRPHLSDVDAAALTGDYARFALESARRALAPGIAGWRDDDWAFVAPWGFELDAIRVPVLLRQGRQDRMVPFAHGEWLAERIPGVQAKLSESDGHLTLVRGLPDVHAWLLERFRTIDSE